MPYYYKDDNSSHDELRSIKHSSKSGFYGYYGGKKPTETLEYKIHKFFTSTSTKYDENGRAITTKPSKSGPVHRQLMKTPGRQTQKVIVSLLICLTISGIVTGLL